MKFLFSGSSLEMDYNLVRSVVEAYWEDHPSCVKEAIVEDVMGFIQRLRREDYPVYEELCRLDRMGQVKVILGHIRRNFGDCRAEPLYEAADPLTMATFALAYVLLFYFRRPLAEKFFKFMERLGQFLDQSALFFQRHGRYWKLRYNIVQANLEKCYILCKVNLDLPQKGLGPLSYLAFGEKLSKKLVPAATYEKVQCLAECYVNSYLDVIDLYARMYFSCLKDAGKFDEVKKVPGDRLTIDALVFGKNICYDYWEKLSQSVNFLGTLLDFVYRDKNEKKEEKLAILRQKLSKSRDEIDKDKNYRKYLEREVKNASDLNSKGEQS